jgi:hypothetical protein
MTNHGIIFVVHRIIDIEGSISMTRSQFAVFARKPSKVPIGIWRYSTNKMCNSSLILPLKPLRGN